MMIYTLTEAQRQQLMGYLQDQCGLRCNAEYNPCEAKELDTMLQSLEPVKDVPEVGFGNTEKPVVWRTKESDEKKPKVLDNWFYAENEAYTKVHKFKWQPLYTHPAPMQLSDDEILTPVKVRNQYDLTPRTPEQQAAALRWVKNLKTQSAPTAPRELSDDEILTIAHRKATRYTHTVADGSRGPVTYGFSVAHLIDFARAIEKAWAA
mgnify:CR=1 FL=1